ncbi:hypothetical protein C8R46DRAFT_1118139 [Mycena filopes]|nr:hypothetical protein C8R46DRAFT_1118139 [Mycena filopes]
MLVSALFTVLAAWARDLLLPSSAATSLSMLLPLPEAQKFDATATRAFTATTITTSDGKCLSVNPFSGDFRENLTPVTVVACDGSKNQTWDVITAGVHNNTNACLNFDARRAPGNQVLLFSCGGRADGEGQVTDSQQFAFSGAGGAQALVPLSGKNAVCLTVKNGLVDQTACNGAASASGAELFNIGGKGGAAAATTAAATTSATDCAAATVTKTVTVTCLRRLRCGHRSRPPPTVAVVETTSTKAAATTAAAATTKAATDDGQRSYQSLWRRRYACTFPSSPSSPSKATPAGTLNPTAVAESQVKDLTATRAATGVTIKDSDGQCLSVDATAGDFRENLIPVTLKACDGSDGQKFDFITKGAHNDQAASTLIVSSLTQGCLNFDDRRAAGDQVNLFSCGGRADGAGKVTNSQLFPLASAAGAQRAAVCFVNDNGRLGNVACDATKPAANQLFTVGAASGAAPATTAAAATTTAKAATTTAKAATTTVAATTKAATTTTSGPIKVSGAGGTLNPTAVAESQVKDLTATRAATGVQIKDSTGQCLSVDATAGDFRENLIPVQIKACDGSAGQKFDFITKGAHNDQAASTLIVSSLTQGCVNFDGRRAAGDQVNLFSCGGRADGAGQVTNSQLFPLASAAVLKAPYALTPENGNKAVCFVNNNGRLSNVACDATKPSAAQLFTIVA